MITSSHIQVRTSFHGLHFWADAPSEVAFLRNLHRHLFKVEAQTVVDHTDRELEFFIVKAIIDKHLKDTFKMYHNRQPDLLCLLGNSCESVAKGISLMLLKVTNHSFVVTVREDDESAGIYYPGSY